MKKIYNQFSEEYKQLFTNNILQFQEHSRIKNNTTTSYVNFYPQSGVEQNKESQFLIYGQAVNDWDCRFDIHNSKQEIEKLVENSIEFSNSYYPGHCPLDWVNVHWSKSTKNLHIKSEPEKEFYGEMEYTTFRSFFWNVTYKLISRYFNLSEDGLEWTKKIVWSNLYKIAPPQANPNDLECKLQLENSIKLVKKEIEELKPKYCIVLTNEEWWQPFREGLGIESNKTNKSEIISFEEYNGTKIIVTTRPFVGGGENHVSQIIDLIGTDKNPKI